jgi:pyridoxal phosphate enzyme (YggS family)
VVEGKSVSLEEIKARIAKAEAEAGRPEGAVKLIAVSKVQPNERVEEVLKAGHRIFGENRVQEAAGKWPMFRERYDGIELHIIGPLQTNKARQAMDLAQAIHSVDRPKLAETLARLAQERGACPELFIQVNTGEEPQKAGIAPADVDGFVATCRTLDLPIKGLMCIPPVEEEPSMHFALLAKMAARNGLAGLSMGMSGDFEKAISFGATHVRVGSAIFGARLHLEKVA